MTIHNCHAHVLTFKNVPDQFLPFGLVRFLMKYNLTRPLARLLNTLNPLSGKDIFDRYAKFIKQGDQASQEDILKGLMKYYPADTKYVVLSVDMDYMEAGRAPLSFEEQVKELVTLKKKYSDILYPFICADPQRPPPLELVKRYIETEGFKGIKLPIRNENDIIISHLAPSDQLNIRPSFHCLKGREISEPEETEDPS